MENILYYSNIFSYLSHKITSLNEYQLIKLFNYIEKMLTLGSSNGNFNKDKEVIKTKNILIHSVIPFVHTKIGGYKLRKPTLE